MRLFDRLRGQTGLMRGPATGDVEVVLANPQIDDTIAVVTMVARFHKRDVDAAAVGRVLDEVAQDEMTGARPRNALDLVRGAELLNLRARGIRLDDPREIRHLSCPCIVHCKGADFESTRGGFFVVLVNVEFGGRVNVISPYDGRGVESDRELFDSSTGVFILFEDSREPLPELARARLVRR